MEEKKKIVIIDCNSIIHRAFHALPALTGPGGQSVNALYGFLLFFFKAVKGFRPDYMAACFDFPAPTFRHKEFKKYKAKRPPAPEELYSQIPKVKEILKVFQVPVFEKEGFEADDLIGTIARLAARKQVFPKIEAVIASGDRDLFQLLGPSAKVYFLKKGVKDASLFSKEKLEEEYGFPAEFYLDFKALRGDASDNIPGVAGIGEKTAQKLVKDFGSLENLYSALEKKKDNLPSKLREKLLSCKDQAFLSKKLVRIETGVPVDFNIRECRWGNFDQKEAAEAFKKLGFDSLLQRIPGTEKSFGENLRLL